MRVLGKLILAMVVLLVCGWWVVAATEAGKEVWALCGNFRAGVSVDSVRRTLGTGNYLQVRMVRDQGRMVLKVDSVYDLGATACTVKVVNGAVVSSKYSESVALTVVAAWVAAAGFVGLAVFQLLLAAGTPVGKAAWGGQHVRLPGSLRVGSLVSAMVLLFGVVCVLVKGGVVGLPGWGSAAEVAVAILTVVLMLSTLANAVSRSRVECRVMTPVALVLSCACLAVLLGR